MAQPDDDDALSGFGAILAALEALTGKAREAYEVEALRVRRRELALREAAERDRFAQAEDAAHQLVRAPWIAAQLGCTTKTLAAMVRRGSFPDPIRLSEAGHPRWPKVVVLNWLAGNRAEKAAQPRGARPAARTSVRWAEAQQRLQARPGKHARRNGFPGQAPQ